MIALGLVAGVVLTLAGPLADSLRRLLDDDRRLPGGWKCACYGIVALATWIAFALAGLLARGLGGITLYLIVLLALGTLTLAIARVLVECYHEAWDAAQEQALERLGPRQRFNVRDFR